jgi:hypothetical protein
LGVPRSNSHETQTNRLHCRRCRYSTQQGSVFVDVDVAYARSKMLQTCVCVVANTHAKCYDDFLTYVASLFFGFLLLHICVQNAINSTYACFAANTHTRTHTHKRCYNDFGYCYKCCFDATNIFV